VNEVRVGLVDAVRMCAATPADSAGRPDLGRLADQAPADLVVLDRSLRVRETYIAGRRVFSA
jgi:N-acetylglucosamine-6-phosphate deacetylase